jgi:predicted nucleic acid-binding protein
MVLVDTSAIIDYLRENDSEAALALQYILDNNISFGINSLIYQEVLQGVKTEKDFIRLKKYLETQKFYSLKDEKESYASAAKIYFRCRKKGITIGSTIDCLIAQTAMENNLFLLQNDSDFDRISEVAELKMFRIAAA